MKNITILILMIINCTSCQSNNVIVEKSDLEKENLKGRIKTIKIYQGPLLMIYSEYNKDGYIQKNISYNFQGQVGIDIEYFYSDKYLIEKMTKYDDSTFYKIHYKRNNVGQVEEEDITSTNSKIDSRTFYEYDSSNRISKMAYISKNAISYCYTYEYGDRFKKEIHCKLGLIYLYEYTNGLVSKRTEYESNGEVLKEKLYEYNQNRDIILEIELMNNKETDRIQYEYNYDNKGNWIDRSSKNKVGMKLEWKRIIEYY